jgi:NADH:ubiquinone oxidoreductase subunit 5 (subunit L)/multisubunit Na+/H+ antiporter MnhA subunit
LTVISQFISFLQFFGSSNNDNLFSLALPLIFILLTLLLYLLIIRLFVFKTDWIIDKLHLEKGFKEDRIDLNINHTTVLTIATIIIGGLIFVESFPQLCRQIFVFLQEDKMFRESKTSAWIIFQLVKTIIGYLLMTNSQVVVKFMDKEKKTDK